MKSLTPVLMLSISLCIIVVWILLLARGFNSRIEKLEKEAVYFDASVPALTMTNRSTLR